jgi:hypothetical protein
VVHLIRVVSAVAPGFIPAGAALKGGAKGANITHALRWFQSAARLFF